MHWLKILMELAFYKVRFKYLIFNYLKYEKKYYAKKSSKVL